MEEDWGIQKALEVGKARIRFVPGDSRRIRGKIPQLDKEHLPKKPIGNILCGKKLDASWDQEECKDVPSHIPSWTSSWSPSNAVR